MTLAALGALLSPREGALAARVVEAGPRWELPDPPGTGTAVVLWGRTAAPSLRGHPAPLRAAVLRERSLAVLHRRPGVVRVHRLSPPSFPLGHWRAAARAPVLTGVLVEWWAAHPVRRRIDFVLEAAAARPAGGLQVGRGSTVRLRVASRTGAGLLRAAPSAGPGDPADVAAALTALAGVHAPVPRLLAHGRTAGISWTMETLVPGRLPRQMASVTFTEAADVLARFPVSPGPPTALHEDAEAAAAALPAHAMALRAVTAEAAAHLADCPAMLRHGDLSLVNILLDHHRLSGIVDWEHWHPAGVAGADLLQLASTTTRKRWQRPLGERWLSAPWASAGFRQVSAPLWSRLGVRADTTLLQAVGVAWWLQEIAFTLTRDPHRAHDGWWLDTHVDVVLQSLT